LLSVGWQSERRSAGTENHALGYGLLEPSWLSDRNDGQVAQARILDKDVSELSRSASLDEVLGCNSSVLGRGRESVHQILWLLALFDSSVAIIAGTSRTVMASGLDGT
jgi:hypothetical protein